MNSRMTRHRASIPEANRLGRVHRHLIPVVVSHATDLVEHPELVADRILAFSELVGQENVIAGTDCGLGAGRVRKQIAWTKLRALRDGVAIATKKLRS
jgi:5-methyltetrahydropteroyltriglutamate--homocysteine methyltransferase